MVYHLWNVDCNLGMPVSELLIHLNTTVLINKGSNLETTVSFYLSLGDFIFSEFFFSNSYQLNATCTVPQFVTAILLTGSMWDFRDSLFGVLKIIQRPVRPSTLKQDLYQQSYSSLCWISWARNASVSSAQCCCHRLSAPEQHCITIRWSSYNHHARLHQKAKL